MTSPPYSNLRRVLPGNLACALYGGEASRAIEAEALALHAPHTLMQRAGLAVARLALAVAPHAQRIWVACGPGNNGGDGLVAATHLHLAGAAVQASLIGDASSLPADARWALAQAVQSGVPVSPELPHDRADLAIDALLGLGASRAPQGAMAEAMARLNALSSTVLAVDLPSGLNADTGQLSGEPGVRAQHTLALLTLKPGLFTAAGRDAAGQIWLDTLGVADSTLPASAQLVDDSALRRTIGARDHASHKGSYGELAVVGGAPGMVGAGLLAARAALSSGAGRVYLSLLDPSGPGVDAQQPELMLRPAWWRSDPALLSRSTVVCGCGGGSAVREALPALLARCPRLVLDADALNALSTDEALRMQLHARAARGQATVLTPHPLEAARLLQVPVSTVQADRLQAARSLSKQHACVVLLKGSGSIIASPEGLSSINPTGNALLASSGTGDVLAGWIGGFWAQLAGTQSADAAKQATLAATWLHGLAADRWQARANHAMVMRAGELSDWMRLAAATLEPTPGR